MSPVHGQHAVFQDRWETVALVPLPGGWRIIIHLYDGQIHEDPAPVVLLQQHVSTTKTWDDPSVVGGSRSSTHVCDQPYTTRVVPAGWNSDYATFEPVDDDLCGDDQFLGLLPEGVEVPQWMRDKAAAARDDRMTAVGGTA